MVWRQREQQAASHSLVWMLVGGVVWLGGVTRTWLLVVSVLAKWARRAVLVAVGLQWLLAWWLHVSYGWTGLWWWRWMTQWC